MEEVALIIWAAVATLAAVWFHIDRSLYKGALELCVMDRNQFLNELLELEKGSDEIAKH